MKRSTWMKCSAVFIIAMFMAVFVLELDAYARAGGGRSSGSRGSRSSYSPSKPQSSQATSPSRNLTSPAPAAPQAPQRGGFLRSLGAGMAGGLLGGMLFSSLGFGGHGGGMGGGGGIGLFDIILLGALLYGIYWFIKRRKQNAATATSSPAYYQGSGPESVPSPGYAQPSHEAPQDTVDEDRRRGIGYIKQMDPSFNDDKFNDLCMDVFFKIQGAWANRDMSSTRNLLTDEMYRIMQDEAEKMKRERKFNKLENIAVRTVEISEAWQEQGKDFITVRFLANLLDYTVSESGELLEGSKTDPVKFEEYWTLVRPVGNNPWQLSGIDQAE